MESLVDRLDGLLCVHGSGRRDDNRLQILLLLQQLIEVEVCSGISEIGLRPVQFILHGRRDRYHFRAGSVGVEVVRVAGAHAAQTSDSDFELGRHGDVVVSVGIP